MNNFKVGDKVKGIYMQYQVLHDPDSRKPVPFNGKVIHDFQDSSYEVLMPTGESLLIELYDDDKMELDE